jgi:hypothetical protein
VAGGAAATVISRRPRFDDGITALNRRGCHGGCHNKIIELAWCIFAGHGVGRPGIEPGTRGLKDGKTPYQPMTSSYGACHLCRSEAILHLFLDRLVSTSNKISVTTT